jgi:hypothetical protein
MDDYFYSYPLLMLFNNVLVGFYKIELEVNIVSKGE